jgi:hypothetical protein
MFAYPFAAHGVPIPHEKFFFPVPTRWPPLSGKGPAPSGRARRAGQKCCCRHRQTGSRSRAMSGGAALASSRAPEPWDDESDRDEDEDEQQPSFVLEVVAGPERGSLCLDDATDDCDADCDATPMSPTSFLSAHSSTPSKLDDNAEPDRQWAAFSAHYKSKPQLSITVYSTTGTWAGATSRI